MADGLMSHKSGRRVRLHQTLHGYDNGHRLLGGSLEIEGRSAKTLLVMSDVSGSNLRASDESYLTGYPLPDSRFYAIARTWSAPEKSRPGCVWTHTLLLMYLIWRPSKILPACWSCSTARNSPRTPAHMVTRFYCRIWSRLYRARTHHTAR